MLDEPNFVKSPFFVGETNNWHLLQGAPIEVKKEFDEWVEEQEKANEKGILLQRN